MMMTQTHLRPYRAGVQGLRFPRVEPAYLQTLREHLPNQVGLRRWSGILPFQVSAGADVKQKSTTGSVDSDVQITIVTRVELRVTGSLSLTKLSSTRTSTQAASGTWTVRVTGTRPGAGRLQVGLGPTD